MDNSVKAFLEHLVAVNPEKYNRLIKKAKDQNEVMEVFAILSIEEMAREANTMTEFMERLTKHMKAIGHETP